MGTFKDEYLKCFKDLSRQYFIENYLSTFDASRGREVQFKVFPRQKVFLNDLVEYKNNVAIKPRQCGITTLTSGWVTGQIVFAKKGAPETVLCIGNKLDISEQLVQKIGAFLDQVPRWMWGSDFYSPNPDDPKNEKSIYVKRNKQELKLFNGCRVVARSSGTNAARGISAVSILIFDEAAFIENGVDVYSQAVAASASVKNAKIVMVSTPNGKDALYYQTYSQALRGENNYHATEFRWYQDPRYNKHLKWHRLSESGGIEWRTETVLDESGSVEYNEERWEKMIKDGWEPTSNWYEHMCKSFNNDMIKINQELNVSFLGSSDNVVDVDIIQMHRDRNVVDLPDDWELGDPFIRETWIWKRPVEGHRYILAVDPSSGASDDASAIQIIDIDAIDDDGVPYYEQVLEYSGKVTGDVLGGIIDNYGRQYNNALVVVEDTGGWGSAPILTLLSLGYPNLYYDDPALKNPTIQKKYEDYHVKEGDKLPGFHNGVHARAPMIGNFVSMLKNNVFRIKSKRVINELDTWIWKNGRPDHMSGMHDDLLMCLSMGLYVIDFSVVKKIQEGEKSKAMITAWTLNKPSNNRNVLENNKFKLDYSQQYNNPRRSRLLTTDSSNIKSRNKSRAMLLLTGFYPQSGDS